MAAGHTCTSHRLTCTTHILYSSNSVLHVGTQLYKICQQETTEDHHISSHKNSSAFCHQKEVKINYKVEMNLTPEPRVHMRAICRRYVALLFEPSSSTHYVWENIPLIASSLFLHGRTTSTDIHVHPHIYM